MLCRIPYGQVAQRQIFLHTFWFPSAVITSSILSIFHLLLSFVYVTRLDVQHDNSPSVLSLTFTSDLLLGCRLTYNHFRTLKALKSEGSYVKPKNFRWKVTMKIQVSWDVMLYQWVSSSLCWRIIEHSSSRSSFTLKMKMLWSFKTYGTVNPATQHHIPGYLTHPQHSCENLKSQTIPNIVCGL